MRTSARRFPLRKLAALAAGVAALSLSGLVAGQASGARPTSGDGCGDTVPKATGGAWTCAFVDNFDGRSLDTRKWLMGDTSVSGFKIADTCFMPERDNVSVRNGVLSLTTLREAPFTCKSPYGDFTTQQSGGSVTTKGRFSQTYGRYEVRAKFPSTTEAGLHGNFWLYPDKHTYGTWPNSGEIDVAEWWSANPRSMYPSLHYPGRTKEDTAWTCTIADVGSYHTYTLEWRAQEMLFFYDGELCFRRSWLPNSPLVAPQPFDQPFNMVLVLGGGHAEGWNAITSATLPSATLAVDYVKAWR